MTNVRNLRDDATLDAADDIERVERCSVAGCRKLTRALFCDRHRAELARLSECVDGEPPLDAA